MCKQDKSEVNRLSIPIRIRKQVGILNIALSYSTISVCLVRTYETKVVLIAWKGNSQFQGVMFGTLGLVLL